MHIHSRQFKHVLAEYNHGNQPDSPFSSKFKLSQNYTHLGYQEDEVNNPIMHTCTSTITHTYKQKHIHVQTHARAGDHNVPP